MSQPPAFIQHVVELIRGGRQTFPITTSLLVTTLTIILLLKLCEERAWVLYTLDKITRTKMNLLQTTWTHYLYAALAAALAYVVYTKSKRARFPPGPFPLPLIGNALGILGQPLHVTFAQLQKKYGEIFALKVAGVEVVVVNGYENIREVLVHQSKKFSGRPNITWTSLTQKHGIFSCEGKTFSTQKTMVRKMLAEVNWDDEDAAEKRIQGIGRDLVAWLAETGKPVDPQIYLDTAVCNVTSGPLMSITFKPTDDLMLAVSKIAMDIFIDAGAQNVNNYFTFLRDMPGDPTNYHVLMKNASTAMDVLSGVITSHKEKMVENPSSPPADFIDHYLQMMQSGAEPTCTDAQLLAVVTDLFAMGIEATATMLRWALLLLSQHPQVQTRIQKEIDEVMGKTTPSLAHQPEMNFTNSAITEIKRYVNLVSINLPHAATEDAIFQGFFIPKGAVVLPNLASIHYDEETYAEPMTFKPDRFIEGGSFQKPKKFMPYSAGVRSCLGQTVSQWQIFLFLTAILQKFNVSLSGDVKPDVYGLIRFPGEFKVSFKLRESSAL